MFYIKKFILKIKFYQNLNLKVSEPHF
jgi:hypothetical protein